MGRQYHGEHHSVASESVSGAEKTSSSRHLEAWPRLGPPRTRRGVGRPVSQKTATTFDGGPSSAPSVVSMEEPSATQDGASKSANKHATPYRRTHVQRSHAHRSRQRGASENPHRGHVLWHPLAGEVTSTAKGTAFGRIVEVRADGKLVHEEMGRGRTGHPVSCGTPFDLARTPP